MRTDEGARCFVGEVGCCDKQLASSNEQKVFGDGELFVSRIRTR